MSCRKAAAMHADAGLYALSATGRVRMVASPGEPRRIALLKASELQTAILTSASFSIIATDETGIIQLFNVGAERMLGYRAEEVINRVTPSDMHDPVEVIARAEALSLEMSTPIAPGFEALAYKASRGLEDSYELTYICKNGSRFPAIVSITALRDQQDMIIGYLLIGPDNSVRKQAEQNLNEAVLAADKANQAKSEFLSSMSHELRTPLSAILGFAQLIESGQPAPTPSQRRSVEQIMRAGWYLLDLINEILDLALIESGKLSLSLESISLLEVWTECEVMIEPKALEREVTVNFQSPATSHSLMADHTRLKQVLLNLLSNAVKYNHRGGSVKVWFALVGPERIRISVSDTGDGLSPERIAQLFQPFNRLGREIESEPGTGIGLVMTKRLVELMGGSMSVQSTPGSGSVFSIELKLAEASVDLPAQMAAIDPCLIKRDGALRTLLHVEDNPANLMLIEDLLERRPDIAVLTATDGVRGVELARAALPDVILMDINLPGMSGIKALQILNQDPATSHIPIIALSAHAMPRDIKNGLEAGFFCYLTKPIKVNELMDTLDLALHTAAAPTDADPAVATT